MYSDERANVYRWSEQSDDRANAGEVCEKINFLMKQVSEKMRATDKRGEQEDYAQQSGPTSTSLFHLYF